MMKMPSYLILVALTSAYTVLSGQISVIVNDDYLVGNTTYNWTKDTVYFLDGFVFLEAGSVLNIEPGTVIKAQAIPSTGDNTSALIITRGAQIYAEGTANEPIIFTTQIDDVNNPGDISASNRGLWGGVFILGRASTSHPEGLSHVQGFSVEETRASFGGTSDEDNSGNLKYVSIRHSGRSLSADLRSDGLTLAGVGSATQIDHVEIFSNFKDGISILGGTVNINHAIAAFCADDGIQYDLGWQGKGQYWFVISGQDAAGRSGEHNGLAPGDPGSFSNPTIFNTTYIGSGKGASPQGDGNDFALVFQNSAGGTYANSVFAKYPNKALSIEDLPAATGRDAYSNLLAGDLILKNNLWFDFAAGTDLAAAIATFDDGDDPDGSAIIAHLEENDNQMIDPNLGGYSWFANNGLDPRPDAGSPAFDSVALPDDLYFEPVGHKGAFDNDNNWALGWTALDHHAYFGDLRVNADEGVIVIKDEDLVGDTTFLWTSDNTYLLDGLVFLEAGGCLNIEPGTVIKGKAAPTSGDNASALIITRDAQIKAEGTRQNPIIFTAEVDSLGDPNDLSTKNQGLWGGVILLGRGVVNTPPGQAAILDTSTVGSRAIYGGSDNADSSGILRYVSIRHAGRPLSPHFNSAGLTLAGTGSGTIIEHIESFAAFGNGLQILGGAAAIKYASASFCGSNAFFADVGWNGKGQFWSAWQSATEGSDGLEIAGGAPDESPSSSMPTLYNLTLFGDGNNEISPNSTALLFRDSTGGMVHNAIFSGFGYGLSVEDRETGLDSRQRLENGELLIGNNIFHGFATDLALPPSAGNSIQWLVDSLSADKNTTNDPVLISQAKMEAHSFDSRPAGEDAYFGLNPVPEDLFFTVAPYKGAFDPFQRSLWIDHWTAFSQLFPADTTEREAILTPVSGTRGFDESRLAFDESFKAAVDNQNEVISDYVGAGRDDGPSRLPTQEIVIPVVVHHLWNSQAEWIPDSIIRQQIEILNAGFGRKNLEEILDPTVVPAEFVKFTADTKIRFQLARRDPQCNPTTGIIRNQTEIASFGIATNSTASARERNPMKFSDSGGSDAWPGRQYLNIWICDLNLPLQTRGYASHPVDLETRPTEDGVVIHYRNFGRRVSEPYNLYFTEGKTLITLVGKWLNLIDIWADDFNCMQDDFAEDTPRQSSRNFQCPGPENAPTSCASELVNMYCNYMDNTYDDCRRFFTLDQSERMRATIFSARRGLIASDGAIAPTDGGDLWIKTTAEPSEGAALSTAIADSPDIWLRQEQDEQEEHEAASRFTDGLENYLYVRIRNRGCETISSDAVNLFWSKANTYLEASSPWDGQPIGMDTLGGMIGTLPVFDIGPGEEMLLEFPWIVPPYERNNAALPQLKRVQFGFLAELASNVRTNDELYEQIKSSNDLALKNVIVADPILESSGITSQEAYILIGNYTDVAASTTIVFEIPENSSGNSLLDWGSVRLDVGDGLSNWNNTGQGFSPTGEGNHLFEIEQSGAYLDNVSFDGQALDVIRLEFTPNTSPVVPDVYQLLMLQIDEATGDTIGEVLIHLKSLGDYPFFGDIVSKSESQPFETLTNVKVFPNPATSVINVEAANLTAPRVELRLYDLTGKQAFQKTYRNANNHFTTTIATAHFVPGTYVLQVRNGKKALVKKITIF